MNYHWGENTQPCGTGEPYILSKEFQESKEWKELKEKEVKDGKNI